MEIGGGYLQGSVTEERLNTLQIGSRRQQVGGSPVPQNVRREMVSISKSSCGFNVPEQSIKSAIMKSPPFVHAKQVRVFGFFRARFDQFCDSIKADFRDVDGSAFGSFATTYENRSVLEMNVFQVKVKLF